MSIDPAIADRIRDVPLSAHLATTVNDRPHVAPVWYVYENDVDESGEESATISFITGGKKLRNLRRNPRVALSIESYDGSGVNWVVHCLGTARVVEDSDHVSHVQRLLDQKYAGPYGTDGGFVIPEPERQADTDSDGDVADDPPWGLVVVTIGSASMQTY